MYSNPLDIKVLKSQIGDSESKLCEILDAFAANIPQVIVEMRRSATQGDFDLVQREAHRIKSSARAVGALAFGQISEQLEVAVKTQALDSVDQLIEQLASAFVPAEQWINEYLKKSAITCGSSVSDWRENRILLIDDDPMMLTILTMMLEEMGVKHIVGMTEGEDSLRLLETRNHQVDLILLDLNMPSMDGIELLRHIAEANYTGKLILMSGEEKRILSSVEKLAKEHMLHVLGSIEKPVKRDELIDLISRDKRVISSYPKTSAKVGGRLITVAELEAAIDNEIICPYFQPKIDMVTKEVTGVEALVRWRDPEMGMITPDQFIPLAEENGLITSLTKLIFRQSVEFASRMKASGYHLSVAVNFSVDTLTDLRWPELLSSVLDHYDIEPSDITMEITESRLMNKLSSTLEVLTRLSLKRFKLSIDDFGTGYSSMEQLQRIPFSELKIDRQFVNEAPSDRSARVILESSVNLAKSLGMKIVAEGVESIEEWRLVDQLGCDLVQGFFISKPLSGDDFMLWIADWANQRSSKFDR